MVVCKEFTHGASAYRRLKSPSLKTRKRAIKLIRNAKRNATNTKKSL
ncbi:putative metal homeostasis protein [Secundilactobacillus yichangensis]|nr:putative metal homeostasis protein [Secundilactobacillus yichangensis]